MGALIDRLSWELAFLLAVTLGLAPFLPEPHIWQKLQMLAAGTLSRPLDIFDFTMHGLPWLLLVTKAGRALFRQNSASGG